jgi:hypothetical protein
MAFCPHSLGLIPMKGQWSPGSGLHGFYWDHKITPTLHRPHLRGSWDKIEAFLHYVEYFQNCRQYYILDTLWNLENSGIARDLVDVHYYIAVNEEEMVLNTLDRCMAVYRDFWLATYGLPECLRWMDG